VDADAKLPKLVMSGKPLRDRTDETLGMLNASNTPPTIFNHGGALCRHYGNKLQDLNIDIIRDMLTRRAHFVARKPVGGRVATKIINPPEDVMRSILCSGAHLFPPVNGIISWPVLSPSGDLRAKPGYDPRTRLIYAPPAGFKLPKVPARPSSGDVARAVELLSEMFINFPFADEASLANTIGAVLTVAFRSAINGRVVAFVIDSPVRGTGKTLLAQAAVLAVTGGVPDMMPDCKDDEEWAKRLTTIAGEGALVVFFDDVKNALKSPVLAMFVTAPIWKNRLLGTNAAPSYPNSSVLLFTGNNVQLNEDFERRVSLIRLDSKTFRPYERDPAAFRHANLLGWINESRPELLAAMFTIARAWFAAGSPPPKKQKPLGGFEEHMRVIGGMLEFAGIDGFMGNAGTVQQRSAQDNADVVEFLANLDAHYQGKPFTTRDLVDDSDAESLIWPLVAPPTIPRDARKLGRLFAKFSGRPLREDNLRIESCAEKVHNAVQWRVVRDNAAG